MPRQQLLVMFKTTVLIDSYLKDINMFFYSVFFLFKSFLYNDGSGKVLYIRFPTYISRFPLLPFWPVSLAITLLL